MSAKKIHCHDRYRIFELEFRRHVRILLWKRTPAYIFNGVTLVLNTLEHVETDPQARVHVVDNYKWI